MGRRRSQTLSSSSPLCTARSARPCIDRTPQLVPDAVDGATNGDWPDPPTPLQSRRGRAPGRRYEYLARSSRQLGGVSCVSRLRSAALTSANAFLNSGGHPKLPLEHASHGQSRPPPVLLRHCKVHHYHVRQRLGGHSGRLLAVPGLSPRPRGTAQGIRVRPIRAVGWSQTTIICMRLSCDTLVFLSAPLLRNHARYGRTAHGAPRFDDKAAAQSPGATVHVFEAVTVLSIVGG